MSWKIDANGNIEDDNQKVVCILPSDADRMTISIIENAPDMFNAIMEFIEETDSGSLRAKKNYNNFKSIIERINR